jgi:hypothetical protein
LFPLKIPTIQSTATPTSGWTSFASGDTLAKTDVSGDWYLHIRATDMAGNQTDTVVVARAPSADAAVVSNGSNYLIDTDALTIASSDTRITNAVTVSELLGHLTKHASAAWKVVPFATSIATPDEFAAATGKSGADKLAVGDRLKLYLKVFFPNYETMSNVAFYSFVKNRPLLLPAAWMVRFFRSVKLRGSRRSLTTIIQLVRSRKEYKQQVEMMSRLGL